MARKAAKKSTVVSVNFEGVEGRGARIKPGEYLAAVSEVEKLKAKGKGGGEYLAWTFDLDDGGKAYFNTSLKPNALWNLRGLLEAMGVEVPDDEMDIDLEEMVEKRVGVVIEMEEYEGKNRPKMVDYFPEDDASDTSDDEDDDKKRGKKKKGKKAEKVSKEDVDDMDRDGLLELNENHSLGLDEDDYKDNKKGNKKLLADILEKLEEEDLLEGEDEEEEPKKGKKGKKGKKKEQLERSKVEDMDQEELQELIDEHELGVDLDDYKTLRKMVKAVVEALEEADLLED